MPVIKFDVTASDPERAARGGGGGEPAPVGTYVCEIVTCDDEKPDNKDRRLHVVYKIVGDTNGEPIEENYSWLHDYINLVQESSVWKLDQFLLAVGVATDSKRTGSFDPEKQVGKQVKVFVRNETYNREVNGEMVSSISAKPAGTYAWDGAALTEVGGPGEDDERWNEILGMSEDELQEITDELTELSEPYGLDGEDYDTWEVWRDAIGEAMAGGSSDEEDADAEGDEQEGVTDGRWWEILGLDEDALADLEDEINEYAQPYGIDGDDYAEYTAWVEAINDAMNGTDAGATGQDDGEDYSTWSLPDITAELGARGLPTSGSKAAKIARLEENDSQQGAFDS